MTFLPVNIILSLNELLKSDLENLSKIQTTNLILKEKVSICIDFVSNRFKKDPKLSWYKTILANMNVQYMDCTNNSCERHNLIMKRHVAEYSASRSIDGIKALKDFLVFESTEALAKNCNKFGFTKPTQPAIDNFQKISEIVNSARLRDNKPISCNELLTIKDQIIKSFT